MVALHKTFMNHEYDKLSPLCFIKGTYNHSTFHLLQQHLRAELAIYNSHFFAMKAIVETSYMTKTTPCPCWPYQCPLKYLHEKICLLDPYKPQRQSMLTGKEGDKIGAGPVFMKRYTLLRHQRRNSCP